MNFLKNVSAKAEKTEPSAEANMDSASPRVLTDEDVKAWEQMLPDRTLRTFDFEGIAPFLHKPLIAFIGGEKLCDLTPAQVAIFLFLRDLPKNANATASEIAAALGTSPSTVRFGLSALKRLGYAMHSPLERRDARGQKLVTWTYDPRHWFADEGCLYGEFAEL